MDPAELLSVVTPVSRPELLPAIAATVPPAAEWVLVTDGPQPVPAGLREHVLIEGPPTRHYGDAQRSIGIQAATRPFLTSLDDDNVMLPMLADLVIPALERSGKAGALFGLLIHNPGGFYAWPPPLRVERSQVDTAMFLGRTEAAQAVGWTDLSGDAYPELRGQRCGDYVFLRAFEAAHELMRLPAILGFYDGVNVLRHHEPVLWARLARGATAGEELLATLQRHLGQADAPPWWKGAAAAAAAPAPPAPGPARHELLELAGTGREGSSTPGERAHLAALVRELAAERPGQAVNVLEIGFNAGLSAAAFLEAHPQAHVVSFDLAERAYVAACAERLRARFPGRLHLVIGDSRETLPRFAALSGNRFDLVLVDGGHTEEVCRADVRNARAAAAPDALVVVDDLLPHLSYGARVTRAWEGLLAEGELTDPRIWCVRTGRAKPEPDDGRPPETCERRWGVARYAPH